LKEELQVSKATGYGKPIIDFTLEDTSGRLVKLSDFKGKYVFLDFWASWCVPCRKENPNVKKQFEKYKDRGFTVVSVSLDKPDARKAWIEAVRKDGTGIWTQLGDLHGFDGAVAKSYYVRSIPTNFLIGPDGKFLDRNLYGEELGKKLSKIFVGQ
jgi:peroxiredoxin